VTLEKHNTSPEWNFQLTEWNSKPWHREKEHRQGLQSQFWRQDKRPGEPRQLKFTGQRTREETAQQRTPEILT